MQYSPTVKALGAAFIGDATVSAHGHTYGINVEGVYYDPTVFPYESHPPTVVGWTASDFNTGFVAPNAYDSGAIICHVDAAPAGGYASVQAGDKIQVYWTPWLSSHRGPVIDMLANCHGDCTTVNKTHLEFFKIAAAGMVDDHSIAPGHWATDTLMANNNSWVIQIPADLAEGNYVWRHEIIALHSAEDSDGAQNYPQCFNLAVTGTGTLAPTGTPGKALYSNKDAGIAVDIYRALPSGYDIPGPTQIAAGTNLVQSELPITRRAAAYTTGVSGPGLGAATSTTKATTPSSSHASSVPKHSSSNASGSGSSAAASKTAAAVASSSHASSRAPSSSSAPVAHITETYSAVALATATELPGTGQSCKKRPHARGFNA